jgi:nicotinate dehydrogenase subunit B
MSTSVGMDRRSFFKLAGGGIVVLVALGPLALRAQEARRLYPEDFNAYLIIGENGRVTVFSGKIEMGQGAMTSQAQMVAEELGVELGAIDMVLGDTDRCPWDMGTFGSLTTRMFGPALRAAAAQARLTLTELAARQLGVAQARLAVGNGRVFVADEPARAVGFGQLSKGARIAHVVDHKAVLKAAREFRVMGRSAARMDSVEKVSGVARYAADIRAPGMLYARVLRAPMHGASMLGLDTSGAERLSGVTVVRRDDIVAVLHADPEAAAAALATLRADWRLPEATLDPDRIFEHLVAHSPKPRELVNRGQLQSARADSVRLFETTYRKGYVAHAAIEPHAALAEPKDGRMTVWASTQTPFPTRDRIAKVLGLDPRLVRVITPYVGGGFGGKSADAQAVEAARLAQIAGRPVQVAWTRSEEFFNDTFDPAAVVEIVSGIDAAGKISFWDSSVYGAGERGATPCYDLASARIRSAGRAAYGADTGEPSVHPFAVGAWRAPGANMNVFATESQIELMASAAGIDPLEFRLKNLADARMRKVLQVAGEAFGWKSATAPGGRGFGIACSSDAGSYVATIAEVVVDRATGRVSVLRVVCAQDMGIVVNPEGAKMQIEGGLAMGLGYALSEELRFRGGNILDRNFDSYDIPVFSGLPRIEAVLVRNDDLAPQGGGEPSITTAGAVIANAVSAATGVRLFRLPMTVDRVRDAIAKAKAGDRSSR